MQALQVIKPEAASITGERTLLVLPGSRTSKRTRTVSLIRMLLALLQAILRGVRKARVAAMQAADQHNRHFDYVDRRYGNSYYLR